MVLRLPGSVICLIFFVRVADKEREGDEAADDVAGGGDSGDDGDLQLNAAGGGAEDKEAKEGEMTPPPHPTTVGLR